MRLQYSFVIDENPRFLAEARLFVRALLGAGVAPADIVAQVTARCGEPGRALAASFGVRALELPLGPDSTYCNKINQLFTLANEEFDVLVACDTDLAITRPLNSAASLHAIRAKRVDQPNPPLAVLESVRAFLQVPSQPALLAPSIAAHESTYALNCNGGLLMIPRALMRPLGEQWLRNAEVLHDHRHLLQRWGNHIDQVSFAFAMIQLGLPFDELPIDYNFPTTLAKQIPASCYGEPIVLHYHRAIDRRGRIKRCGVPSVDALIKRVNRSLYPRRSLWARLFRWSSAVNTPQRRQ